MEVNNITNDNSLKKFLKKNNIENIIINNEIEVYDYKDNKGKIKKTTNLIIYLILLS